MSRGRFPPDPRLPFRDWVFFVPREAGYVGIVFSRAIKWSTLTELNDSFNES
jgi:hypothetical protein